MAEEIMGEVWILKRTLATLTTLFELNRKL